MNSLIFCLIISISISDDSLCRENFYKEALADTSFSSFRLLKLEIIDSEGKRKSVLIPNLSMYLSLKTSKGIDYKEYQKFMREFYNSGKVFNFTDYGNIKGYVILRNNKYVERFAKGGKHKLINHFFKRGVFQFKYQPYFEIVVGKLFDYGVLVSMKDNGIVVITYQSDCFQ